MLLGIMKGVLLDKECRVFVGLDYYSVKIHPYIHIKDRVFKSRSIIDFLQPNVSCVKRTIIGIFCNTEIQNMTVYKSYS